MKIGVVCGSFDLIHQGHINLIKNAASRCDYLIVGVNSDNRIIISKKHQPILPQNIRLEIIKELKSVKEAYIIDNGLELIEYLENKGLIVNEYYRGDDNKNCLEQKQENKILQSKHIKPVYFKHTKGIHTTTIVNKIKNNT
ncbi:MAG: adenylyltransferase/cytidyltransferase family protein [Alphaproteobacteria bacterium]